MFTWLNAMTFTKQILKHIGVSLRTLNQGILHAYKLAGSVEHVDRNGGTYHAIIFWHYLIVYTLLQ